MTIRGEWSDAIARRWVAAGRDGVNLYATQDLLFPPAVPRLGAVRVRTATRDDGALPSCSDLEFLDLDTRATTQPHWPTRAS